MRRDIDAWLASLPDSIWPTCPLTNKHSSPGDDDVDDSSSAFLANNSRDAWPRVPPTNDPSTMASHSDDSLRRSPRKKPRHIGGRQNDDADTFGGDGLGIRATVDEDVFALETVTMLTDGTRHLDIHATPRAARQTSILLPLSSGSFTDHLQRSASSARGSQASSRTSQASSTSGTSGKSRSSSPIKHAHDLYKLERPVQWIVPSKGQLDTVIADTGSAAAKKLYEEIKRVTSIVPRGYLPQELRPILQPELQLDDQDAGVCFASAPRDPPTWTRDAAEEERIILSLSLKPGSNPESPSDAQIQQSLSLRAMYDELRALRDIVACSTSFASTARSEAAWNDYVHSRILQLAVKDTPGVRSENVTRANIAKAFMPEVYVPMDTAGGGKMIDYVLMLTGDGLAHLGESASEDEERFARRLTEFVVHLNTPTFNQSTYPPLCYSPTGVFIETKVDPKRYDEGQAQLGLWLAAWFGRVASFPSTASDSPSGKLPFVPVIIVVCDAWELFFAFESADSYKVYGPVKIGRTDCLNDAYRLLTVLRLLSRWVVSDFRDWVRRRVEICQQSTGT